MNNTQETINSKSDVSSLSIKSDVSSLSVNSISSLSISSISKNSDSFSVNSFYCEIKSQKEIIKNNISTCSTQTDTEEGENVIC